MRLRRRSAAKFVTLTQLKYDPYFGFRPYKFTKIVHFRFFAFDRVERVLPLEPRPGARRRGRSQAPDVPAAAHGSSFQPDLWTGPILADGVNDEVLVHLVILGQSIFFQTTDISVLIQLVDRSDLEEILNLVSL